MSIETAVRVHTIPTHDDDFREVVGRAVAAVTGATRRDGEPIEAPEPVIRAALGRVRIRYPHVAIRAQDPLASFDGRPGFYVIRDGL